MKIKILAHGQEYSNHWPGQMYTKLIIENLTAEYIHALRQTKIKATVTINIDSIDNIGNLSDKDVEIYVETDNNDEKDKIWRIINEIRMQKQRNKG